MRKIDRAIVIVLDSVGIGELPDAGKYGDNGSNTLKNIAKAVGGLNLPNLESLGLGNIENIEGVKKVSSPKGFFGRMSERSNAKDTTSGHWEMMGIVSEIPFPVYPDGFPAEIIEALEKKINRKVLGNHTASGTEIIKILGDEHVKTGYPIVYTSADSVFQIAAHEDVISVKELYDISVKAREILKGQHTVARVIARPFIGGSGSYERTRNRKDFSRPPPKDTVLDALKKNGTKVIGIGKISDIFCGRGISNSYKSINNLDGILKTKYAINNFNESLIFTNLIDFDMIYGHRNNISGYAKCLEEFDSKLPEIIDLMKIGDLLIITADHGCDPTTESTNHTREYVPLIAYTKINTNGKSLGVRNTFSDLAATLADVFKIAPPQQGKSFYNILEGLS